jgi:hypothetical protein
VKPSPVSWVFISNTRILRKSFTQVSRLVNSRIAILALVSFLAGLTPPAKADEKPGAPAKDKAAHLFAADKVWTFHLEISAKNWEAMHPSRSPGFFGFPAAPAKEKEKDKDQPPAPPRGGFGFDFEYVKGTLEFDGKKWPDVGVRFKGNSSYSMTAKGLKRPFKIDFDRYVEGGEFHGLKMINLANNAMDPTQLRESLGYAVFRAAGVPASRTAFVELYLTVPGKYDKELLGLYTLIEQVDKTFLKNHFKNAKGLLVKPEGIQGLPYLGPDWKPYGERYRAKKDPDEQARQRLIEFTRLVNFADDAEFDKRIPQFLDLDEFLRYLAACSAMVDLDSFVGFGHNYYLFLNPADQRFTIIPWDLNHTFGGLTMLGSSEQQMDWSIKKPYVGTNRLTQRVLAIEANEALFRKHLRNLTAKGFNAEALHAQIDRMQKAVQEVKEKEAKARKNDASGLGWIGLLLGGAPPDLKKFITRRSESLVAQLDGKAEGKEIAMGFPGARAGLGNQLAKPILTAADADMDGKLSWGEASAALKQLFAECDKEKKGVLDEKALSEGINRLLPRRGGGRPTVLPAGFGPGVHLAGLIFKKAGSEKNQLTEAALLAFGEKLFRDADKGKTGLLGEKELIDGLNTLPPASILFGPPPAAPAPPKKPDANDRP